MTTSDWILDIALILVVFRQIRWSRIDALAVIVPLGIVAYVAHRYLNPIPTGGNDLLVIGVFAAVGLVLGLAGGLTTHMRVDQGKVYVRAGFVAASLWILGMGGRLAFAIWSEHSGGPTLVRFSEQHQITSIQAWVSALILMVLCEVCGRVGTIVIRAQLAKRAGAAATASASGTAGMGAAAGVTSAADGSVYLGSVTEPRQILKGVLR
jgi:hypothetical protein